MLHFKFPKVNLSIKLLLVLVATILFGNQLPLAAKSALYAISLNLKGLLLFILPPVIFSCLFSCLLSFRGSKAISFMLVLFTMVCGSNFISTLIAYGVGSTGVLDSAANINAAAIGSVESLEPLWNFNFPQWIPNDYALYVGFLAGISFSLFPNKYAYQFSEKAKNWVTLFLEKCFLPTLPVFALGFILKMQHDGVLIQVIESYLPLLLIIILTYLFYLGFLFAIAANFNFKDWLKYIKSMLPVSLMAFSTMSSLATMPVTLKVAEKNTRNSDLARAIIPTTVNIHMIGASIAIPLMAFAILLSFGHEFPSLSVYLPFACYSILARTAAVAVPGGGILVMLPLLESHLGFTGEMSALITALFILFDPAVTVTNVLGNSALAIIATKIFMKLFKRSTAIEST